MRNATKSVATWFGITAGIAGLEHGYFETLQGNKFTENLVIHPAEPRRDNPDPAIDRTPVIWWWYLSTFDWYRRRSRRYKN
jgi:hypothetical protein